VNWNDSPYLIQGGDRIAQILLHKQYDAVFDIVEQFDPEYSHRGDHGFGSTGR
jgi:dUTPase